MTSANKVGFFDRVASPFVRRAVTASLLGAGISVLDINNSHIKENNANITGQILDAKLQGLTIQREHNAAVARLSGEFDQERRTNQERAAKLEEENAGLNQALLLAERENGELLRSNQVTQNELITRLSQAEGQNGVFSTQLEQAQKDLSGVRGDINRTNITLTGHTQQIDNLSKAGIRLADEIDAKLSLDQIQRIISEVAPSTVTIFNEQTISAGSVIQDNDGKYHILTCAHSFESEEKFLKSSLVIIGYKGAFSFVIKPSKLENGLVPWSQKEDISFIELPEEAQNKLKELGIKGIPIANLNEEAKPGDFSVAIGAPFGNMDTVTFGIVSNSGRTNPKNSDTKNDLQTDAATNPGNSGGAFILIKREGNKYIGKLAGVNSYIIGIREKEDGTGKIGSLGLGFAVNSNVARENAHRWGIKISSPEEESILVRAEKEKKAKIQEGLAQRKKVFTERKKEFLETPLLPIPPAPEPAEIAPPPPPEDSITPMPDPLFDPPAPAPGSVIPEYKRIPSPNIPLQDEPLKEAPPPPPE